MKRKLFGLMLIVAFLLAGASLQAADEGSQRAANPVDQFTGKYWVNTPETSKEAYLYGIESAIEVEYYINSRMAAEAAKAGKKPGFTLSPFEKGWMDAFKNMPRKQIAAEVDKWYADNPGQLDRPVLTVIWYELIKPRLDNKK